MKSWHEYYRDKNKVEILIKYSIKLPSKVENFDIDVHPIHVRQSGEKIHVNYHKKISQALLKDIKDFFKAFSENRRIPDELIQKNPSRYIVGYIGETLAEINKEILDRKYREGHLILRTISQFDIYNVFIVDNTGNYYAILWPLALPKFPPPKKIKECSDAIFVRDLIDAMTEYFYFNLDECIRKIITSLENYFVYYKLKPIENNNSFFAIVSRIFKSIRSRFAKLVEDYIVVDFYPFKERDLKNLRDNILFVYKIRCLIAHDILRLRPDNLMFCKKAISTLLYIYQSKFTYEDGKRDYIFFILDMQFKHIADMIIGLNLDKFERAKNHKTDFGVISNDDEFNEWIFSNLKITDEERSSALKQ